jgi:hypothetical protein
LPGPAAIWRSAHADCRLDERAEREVQSMTKRILMALLTVGLLAAMLPGAAIAGEKTVDYPWGSGPNQGKYDATKFVVVPGGASCCEPISGEKVEGDLGRYQKVYSYYPIAFISVKSGKDVELKWSYAGFDYDKGKYYVEFKLTKDISNYVVWTCPCVPNGVG